MRHTKHDALSGRKATRRSELDLPTRADMRKVGRWLSKQPDRTELPKTFNIAERKRRNRDRKRAVEHSLRWKQRNRERWNAKMREYRKRWKERDAAKKAEQASVPPDSSSAHQSTIITQPNPTEPQIL